MLGFPKLSKWCASRKIVYDEANSTSTDLNRLLNNSDDYMDGVHALREVVRADMVMLIVKEASGSCGSGFVQRSISPTFESFAFSVVRQHCASGSTVAHELGHNWGLNHDPVTHQEDIIENGYPPEYFDLPETYAHGWFDRNAEFGTLMSYLSTCSRGGADCSRLYRFSDAQAVENGAPRGNAAIADADRILRQTVPLASAYRSGDGGNGDGPDLMISDATLSASSVQPGDELRIDVTVLNDGDAVAPSSELRYYWSTDPELDSGDDEVDDDGVRELDPGEEDDENDTFLVPDGPSGTYYVIAVADADEEVSESNEGNNVQALAVTVSSVNQAAISLSSSSISFGAISVGQTQSRSLNVSNAGSAPLIFTPSVTGDGFSFLADPGTVTLQPNSGRGISVQFQPGSQGTFTGTIQITHNAPNEESPISIALSGEGIEYSGPQIEITRFELRDGQTHYLPDEPLNTSIEFCWSDGIARDSYWQQSDSADEVLDESDDVYLLRDVEVADFDSDGCYATGVRSGADFFGNGLGSRYLILSVGGSPNGVSVDDVATIYYTVTDDTGAPTITMYGIGTTFAPVAVGSEVTVPVSIDNDGVDDLIISTTLASGSQSFSIVSQANVMVPGGSSHDIQVRFAPTQPGFRSDTLLISHNVPNAASPLRFWVRGTGEATGDLVDLEIPDVTGRVGQQLRVPIDLSGLNGREVLAYQFELRYDPEVVDFQSADNSGTLSDGWSVTTNETGAGTLAISGASAQPFMSDGVLLYLVFDLTAAGTSTLDWQSGRLNEGNPLTMVSRGSITVTNCGPCGDVSEDGTVSPFDAAYVLQRSVGIQPPTFATCAADPTQNGEVSSLDASYILQYTAGLRSELVCSTPPNAAMAAPPAASLLAGGAAEATWDAEAGDSGVWTLALSLNRSALSATLDLEIDGEAAFTVPEGSLPAGWVSFVRSTETGARIAFAGPEPLPEGWEIPIILSGVREERASITGSVSVDEQLGGELVALSLVEAPEELALTSVFPNPTSASATVNLSLPEPSSVRVELFDVLGRLVHVVQDIRLEAGIHTLQTPTRDLAPGRYFIAVTTDGERFSRPFTVTD